MPTFRFTQGERHIFRRLPPMRVSDWSRAHLIVPDGPYKGSSWRREVAPYAVGIMDAWAEPWVEEVIVQGAPQTGKTMAMYACMSYAVDRRPGPRMLAMPDDPAITKMLEQKLRPMFQRTQPVRKLLRKYRTSGATGVHFRDGSILHLVSAQSPSQRASIPVQDLFLDEEDLYKQFAGAGVPVMDLIERTRSYAHKRKIMRVSKPVGDEETSSIHKAALEADELRRYEARCPACGTFQTLTEDGLACAAESTDPLRVRREKLGRYRCAACAYLWSDHLRDVAVAAGRWQAEAPVPRPRSIAFHLPAILSRSVSLSEILAAKLKAEASDDPDVKQSYDNGYWARPYKPVVEETDEQKILALRDPVLPPRVIPRGHVALTAGIDMQKNHFWFTVYAWTPGLECALIDYGRLRDWTDVEALIWETTYPQESGGPALPIWRAGLDTGGTKTDVDWLTRTEECYMFVRQQPPGRIFATKGASGARHTPVTWTVLDKMPRSRAAIIGGLTLYLLDTSYFKSLIFARLKPDARQPIHLHAETEASFARQITAERQVRGRDKLLHWKRTRSDNHYLDCSVIAFACAHATWTPGLQALAQLQLEQEAARTAAQAQAARPAAPIANPYTGEEARP